jgi:hypothetical protein
MLAAIGIAGLQKSDSLFSVNNAAQDAGVSESRIKKANVVLEYAPKLVIRRLVGVR